LVQQGKKRGQYIHDDEVELRGQSHDVLQHDVQQGVVRNIPTAGGHSADQAGGTSFAAVESHRRLGGKGVVAQVLTQNGLSGGVFPFYQSQ